MSGVRPVFPVARGISALSSREELSVWSLGGNSERKVGTSQGGLAVNDGAE